MGEPVGLRYEGVEAVMRFCRIKRSRELFDDLRAMEAAALDVWRQRTEESRHGNH